MCIAMIFSFIWTNSEFYAQTYTSIRSAQSSVHCSHSLASDLSLSGNGHSNEKKSEKEICFCFCSFNEITITIHARSYIAYINRTPYIAFTSTNHSQFSYLTCILKSKNCLHFKRRSFHFNFFSPFCRQSSTLNEWYDDVIIQTTVFYSLFSRCLFWF